MAALKKLLTHPVVQGATAKVPPAIIQGPDGNELNQVKDTNGNVLWGRYKILMEDDSGKAKELDSTYIDRDSYSHVWEDYKKNWFENFKLYFSPDLSNIDSLNDPAYFAAYGISAKRNLVSMFDKSNPSYYSSMGTFYNQADYIGYFIIDPRTTDDTYLEITKSNYSYQYNGFTLVKPGSTVAYQWVPNDIAYFHDSAIVLNSEQNRKYLRAYHGETLLADVYVRPGFYLTSLATEDSWGGSFGNGLVLKECLTEDYIIDNDIRSNAYSLGIRPKSGNLQVIKDSGTSRNRPLVIDNLERLGSFEAMENLMCYDASSPTLDIVALDTLEEDDKLYFGDKVTVTVAANPTYPGSANYLKYPRFGQRWDMMLTNLSGDNSNTVNYLTAPNQYIPIDITTNYAVYPGENFGFYEQAISTKLTGYGLDPTNAVVYFNKFFTESNFPVTFVTDRSGLTVYGKDRLFSTSSTTSTYANSDNNPMYKINLPLTVDRLKDLTAENEIISWDIADTNSYYIPQPRGFTLEIPAVAGSGILKVPVDKPNILEVVYTYDKGDPEQNKLMKLNLLDLSTEVIEPEFTYDSSGAYIRHPDDDAYDVRLLLPNVYMSLPLNTPDTIEVNSQVIWSYRDSRGNIISSAENCCTLNETSTTTLAPNGQLNNDSLGIPTWSSVDKSEVEDGTLIAIHSDESVDVTLKFTVSIPARGVAWSRSIDFTITECTNSDSWGEWREC